MSVDLSVIQRFTATLADGTSFELGSLTTAQTITLTSGHKFETIKTIADNYGYDAIWTKGDGGLDTFEVALIYSDADVVLELKTDNATPEYILLKIQGGVWHILLTSDDMGGDTVASIDGAVTVDGTDYDQIQEISAQRDVADAAGDAIVHLVLLN